MKSKCPKQLLLSLMMAAVILNGTSCGTWLHPERKGQQSGRIDPAIAVLDGIGLLFFIIPGIIAFAVDFSNGTIYLPSSTSRVSMNVDPNDLSNVETIKLDKRPITKSDIEAEIENRTDKRIDLNSPNVIVTRLDPESGAYRSVAPISF